jgi:hypothetical protein
VTELSDNPYVIQEYKTFEAGPLSRLEQLILYKTGHLSGLRDIDRLISADIIARVIGKLKLNALSVEQQLPYLNAAFSVHEKASAVATKLEPLATKRLIADKSIAVEESPTRQILLHGGMISPHLHHEGKIYKLNADQWNQFANIALEELRSKFAQVKTVSFDSFMKLAEVAEEIL